MNVAPNPPETSSEILDDVLKQLDKLSPDKRQKVLDRLNAANLIGSDLKTPAKQMSVSTTVARTEKTTEIAHDEADVSDLHTPKMSTPNNKRGK